MVPGAWGPRWAEQPRPHLPECPGHVRNLVSWLGCGDGAPAMVLRHCGCVHRSVSLVPGEWACLVVALGHPIVTRSSGMAGFLGAGLSRRPQAAPGGVETTGPAAASQEHPPHLCFSLKV